MVRIQILNFLEVITVRYLFWPIDFIELWIKHTPNHRPNDQLALASLLPSSFVDLEPFTMMENVENLTMNNPSSFKVFFILILVLLSLLLIVRSSKNV